MTTYELANLDDSTRFVLQTALLMRTGKPTAESVLHAVAIARELASEGAAVPPLGLLYDLAAIATGSDEPLADSDVAVEHALFRRYDDYILGRCYGDPALQRGGYAIERYEGGDKVRALAYLAERAADRAQLPAVMLNPAIFKTLTPKDLEARLAETWDALLREGMSEWLKSVYAAACDQMRVAGPLLGLEDVFELEHALALRPLSERVALRQAWQAAAFCSEFLPKDRPPVRNAGRQVATRVEDEDLYPVGGYSSLSNRGSMESLLHSQLAYMEDEESPDLFDVKLLRNELLFFARDENTFYRRRKTIVVQLDASLEAARVKDAAAPWQRMTMACGMLLAAFRTLDDWLTDHALHWLVVLPAEDETDRLAVEGDLLRVALGDEINQQRVAIDRLDDEALSALLAQLRRRSEVHGMHMTTAPAAPSAGSGLADSWSSLHVGQEVPQLILNAPVELPGGEPAQAWREATAAWLASMT